MSAFTSATQRATQCADSGVSAILFTRVPVPGAVKTRLLDVLSAQAAAELMRAMALDVFELLCQNMSRVVVALSTEADSPELQPLKTRFIGELTSLQHARYPHTTLAFDAQQGANLGQRMAHAQAQELKANPCGCLLLGSDLPELTSAALTSCVCQLKAADCVLGPSSDGGYWLLGSKAPTPELFNISGYGGSTVLEQTCAHAHEAAYKLALGPTLSDVDDKNDLVRLFRKAQSDPGWPARRTTQVLKRLSSEFSDLPSNHLL